MIPAVTQRPRARLDLLEQFVYFGEQASVELAERYLDAVGHTCLQLMKHPYSGVLYDSGIARLEGWIRLSLWEFAIRARPRLAIT
jgi:plasmid stabilization system protein ParE